MKSNILTKFTGILTGILFTLFFISLGLIIAIYWRGLYYHDITSLHISENSGYSESVIRENYDALIDYCSPLYEGDLIFPSLPASTNGLIHFAEVKNIFVAFHYLLILTFLMLVILGWFLMRYRVVACLKISSITTIVLPTLVGLFCSINFEKTFTLFHKLFFRNNYWLFNPETDPIILLLPSEYFLHCAIVIIVTIIVGGALQFLFYLYWIKRQNHRNK